jgi:predicted transcriptional regulator
LKRRALAPEPIGKKKKKSANFIKRNQLELLVDFLNIASEPVKKTHVIYSLQINHYQFQSYLNMLLKFGMIEQIERPFKGLLITQKGRMLLEIFNLPKSPNETVE